MIALWTMLALIACGVLIIGFTGISVLRAALSLKRHVEQSADNPLFEQLENGSANAQRLSTSLQTMTEQLGRIKSAIDHIRDALASNPLMQVRQEASALKTAFADLITTLR